MLCCPGVTRGGGPGPPKMFTPPSPTSAPPKLCWGGRAAWVPPWGGGGVGTRGTIGVLAGTPPRGQLLKEREPAR